MFQVDRLHHVALHVKNMQQSLTWYQAVLGMQEHRKYQDTTGKGNPVEIRTGDAILALFPSAPDEELPPFGGHIAMHLSRANFEQAQTHIRAQKVDFKFAHYPLCDAIYFYDPNGYQIELCTYEMS